MTYISAIRNKELYINIVVMHIIGKDSGLYLAICIALKRKLLIVNDWRNEKMDEYISKQRAKDLMGCCLASAKAEHKAAKEVFTKARFGDYISTIQAMIDVVGSVEAADVQPVKRGRWIWDSNAPHREHGAYKCSNCGCHSDFEENYCYNCGARIDGDTE